jgi:CBS domain-containing protein
MNGDVTVRDVMAREYVGVSESDPVLDTVALLLEEEADSAVVLRGSEPVGLLAERDVLELLTDGRDPDRVPVAEAMTPAPDTVGSDVTASEAASVMSAGDTRRLLVVEEGEVLGVLTEHDLLEAVTIEQVSARAGPAEAAVGGEDGIREDEYSAQSICEACSALTRDLVDVNGQLLCTNCRDL